MHITKDERYPDYTLIFDGDTGWIPGVEIPAEALTAEEVADYQRVEALRTEWQRRLGDLYKEAKAETDTHEHLSTCPSKIDVTHVGATEPQYMCSCGEVSLTS